MAREHLDGDLRRIASHTLSRRRAVQLIGFGLASTPVIGLLSACGGSSSTPASSNGTTGTTNSTSAAPASTSAASSGSSAKATTTAASSGSVASPSVAAAGPPPTQGGTLTVGLQQEPSTLDPHASANALAHRPLVCLYDTLVVQDDQGTVMPALADKWDVSSDGKSYTFTLKQGVKFHDGTSFNADAVKFNFDRIVDPNTKSTSAVAIIGPYASTDVVDPNTARANFKDAFAPFLDSASQEFLGMVSPAAVQKSGQDFNLHPVGSGPFKFVELVPQDHITVERNPDYNWAPAVYQHKGPAYLDKIVFKTITENNTRISTLKTGETNLIEAVPAQQLPSIQSDAKYKIITHPTPGAPSYAAINVKKSPTDDVNVRKAINYAVDQKQIVEALFKGVATPANNVISPGTLGYDASAAIYSYDPKKAGDLLDQAGWKAGSGGTRSKNGQPLQITDAVISGLTDESVAQLIQGMLLQVGIDLKITSMARAAWYDANNSGANNLTHVFYVSSDPDVLRNLYWSQMVGKAFNWSQYSNPKVDDLLTQGLHTTDPKQRADIYSQAQKILMDDAVCLPIYNQIGVSAAAANVYGYTYDLRAYPRYYDAYIAK